MSRRKPPVADENPLVWKERYVGGPDRLVARAGMVGSAHDRCADSGVPRGRRVSGRLDWRLRRAGGDARGRPRPSGWEQSGGVARTAAEHAHRSVHAPRRSPRHPAGQVDRRAWAGAVVPAGRWPGYCSRRPLGGTPVVAVPLLVLAAAAYLALAAVLGLWLSVRARIGADGPRLLDGVRGPVSDRHVPVGRRHAWREPVPMPPGSTFSPPPEKKFPAWSRAANPVMAWQDLAMSRRTTRPRGTTGSASGTRGSGRSSRPGC